MRNVWLVVGAIAILAVVGLLLAGCRSATQATGGTGARSAPAATPAATTGATVYTCPMHPQVVSDKPGQCPKCGMNLVPKQTGAEASGEGAAASKPAATTDASAPKASAPKPAAQAAPAAQTYYCPMHPEVTSDKPGRCPQCGMNLVLKEKGK